MSVMLLAGENETPRFICHACAVADFLESIPAVCPHALFTREEDVKARASQARPEFADASHAIVTRKENAATDTAALIIPAVGNNKLRHETLQRFMLANDSVRHGSKGAGRFCKVTPAGYSSPARSRAHHGLATAEQRGGWRWPG